MVIRVLAVGKLRDAGTRVACEGYTARLRRHFKVEIHEVTARGRDGTPADRMRAEGAALLAALPDHGMVVGLTREGRGENSAQFARRIAAWQRAARDVAILIGGADGLDSGVLKRCDARLSLSPFTLPHELARLILLEQLYRAGTILKGEPYHKGPE